MTGDRINLGVYSSPTIVRSHSASHRLYPPEQTLFRLLRHHITRARVLDVGVGAGRTTAYVAPFAADYVGIDWSHPMVASAQRTFPNYSFHHADARDLSLFTDQSFHFILFSFNGIDCVNHDDRLTVLREFHRVLAATGWLMFSSHNRAFARQRAYKLAPSLRDLLLPLPTRLREIGRRLRTLRTLARRHHLARFERHDTDYSILNDSAHNWSCIHYYIEPAHQVGQLRSIGFEGPIYLVDTAGNYVDTTHATSPWVYYAVRKTPAPQTDPNLSAIPATDSPTLPSEPDLPDAPS
jgi:SAM-dependent methyltransferase